MSKNRKIKDLRTCEDSLLFLILLFLSLVLNCISCGDTGKKPREIDNSKTEFWFVLKDGTLEEVSGIEAKESECLLPWTVQERITDIAFFNERLYFAVNGFGIAILVSVEDNQYTFKPFYDPGDPGYFKFKTITSIMPFGTSEYDAGFLCHLYFDPMIFPFRIDDIFYDSANLIMLYHTRDELFIEELYPYTPEQEPHWEIVRILPYNKDTLYLEWKNSQRFFSEFKYSCYSVNERTEEDISWEEFLAAYRFISLGDEKTPELLQLLCEKVMEEIPRNIQQTTFHFLLEDKDSYITSRYIHKAIIPMTDIDFEIVTIRLFKDKNTYYALTDSGFIYYITAENNSIQKFSLPLLPSNFLYTKIFIYNELLILAWEESKFVNVGAAGLLILKDVIQL